VIKWRPTITDYKPRARIPKQQYDREYPFYKLQEAGITEDQFEKIVVHLFENTSAENLAKAPGIGIKKAKELVNKIRNTAEPDQKKLIEF
jgi:hypothetical protein